MVSRGRVLLGCLHDEPNTALISDRNHIPRVGGSVPSLATNPLPPTSADFHKSLKLLDSALILSVSVPPRSVDIRG